MQKNTVRIVVHGGAWSIPHDEQEAHIQGCYNAIEYVLYDLQHGMLAQEALCRAVEILESDPTFDAGKGSVLNSEGFVELDASIMRSKDFAFASVLGIEHYEHPIRIAESILEENFTMLAGVGAEKYAMDKLFTYVENDFFIVPRERQRFEELQSKGKYNPADAFSPKGTVGAVVLDIYGDIVAGTSTGGAPFKHPGRVGDSPLCGAGTYADDSSGGASATGFGEDIMRVLLTKSACDFMKTYHPSLAVNKAIEILYKKCGGYAGLIALNFSGEYGIFCNTEHIAHAYVDTKGDIVSRIFCD
ncbi:MAG: isoaspartyl peptidase/L-asparaginase family protein [Desulfovibrionaceae bacterium]